MENRTARWGVGSASHKLIPSASAKVRVQWKLLLHSHGAGAYFNPMFGLGVSKICELAHSKGTLLDIDLYHDQ